MVMGLASALSLIIYPGYLFGVLRAIPFWNTVILIPLFLIQALSGGIAAILILNQMPGSSLILSEGLVHANMIVISLSGIVMALYLLNRFHSGFTSNTSTRALLNGKYRFLFWGGSILGGVLIPVLLMLYGINTGSFRFLGTAAVFQLLGIFLFKYSMLNAGAYSQVFGGESGVKG